MRHLVTLFLLMAVSLPSSSITRKEWFRRLDSLLERRYYKGDYDTLYVVRPDARITIRNREGLSGTGVTIKSTFDGQLQTAKLSADHRFVVTLGASYRGLALSFSLNPAKLRGKYKDWEFETNEYSNRFGFDIILHNSKTHSGTREVAGVVTEIPTGLVHHRSLQVNAYYAFNHRRFSYAAAFSQSYLQKRSAGSWLASFSFMGSLIDISSDAERGIQPFDLNFYHLGVGGGYGYNYVPAKGWLIHLSGVPNIVVYDRSRLLVGVQEQRLKYRFPELIFTGRFAVVRNFKHVFLGTQVVANYSADGNKRKLFVSNRKWRGRIFLGVRF